MGLDSIPNRLIEAMASLDESVVGQLEGALERIEKISKEVEEEIKETKELMEVGKI